LGQVISKMAFWNMTEKTLIQGKILSDLGEFL
jgi:hypothetical protein